MGNAKHPVTNEKALKSLEKNLKSKKWVSEPEEHFMGFSHYCLDFYGGGDSGNARCGISDECVMFKYPAGSRQVIEFESNEEALKFWNRVVGLPVVYKEKIKCKFKKKDRVVIVKDTNDGTFANRKNLIGVVGTINNIRIMDRDIMEDPIMRNDPRRIKGEPMISLIFNPKIEEEKVLMENSIHYLGGVLVNLDEIELLK